MPIAKGEPWGRPGPAPDDAAHFTTDAELAVAAAAALDGGVSLQGWLQSGDLLRTVGGSSGVKTVGAEVQFLPVDLGFVSLDGGEPVPFVAHVIARRRWWIGEAAAVMNAAWWGRWYLGPKSHPNDGLLDVTIGSLPLRQRLEARKRAPSGTHLPHPELRVQRVGRWEHQFDRTTPIEADGRPLGTANRIEAWLVTDAFTLLV